MFYVWLLFGKASGLFDNNVCKFICHKGLLIMLLLPLLLTPFYCFCFRTNFGLFYFIYLFCIFTCSFLAILIASYFCHLNTCLPICASFFLSFKYYLCSFIFLDFDLCSFMFLHFLYFFLLDSYLSLSWGHPKDTRVKDGMPHNRIDDCCVAAQVVGRSVPCTWWLCTKIVKH